MSAQTVYTLTSLARTVSGSSGQLSVSAFNELAFDANTTIVTGTSPTLQFVVQRLGADGIWYTFWSSTSRTATGVDSKSIGAGLTQSESFTGTIQVLWNIGGTSPSFTFSLSLIGK